MEGKKETQAAHKGKLAIKQGHNALNVGWIVHALAAFVRVPHSL